MKVKELEQQHLFMYLMLTCICKTVITVSGAFRQDLRVGWVSFDGFFSASPCYDRSVSDRNVQAEERCLSSCQPLTFPEVIAKKGRQGRKEGSLVTESSAIVCEAVRQLNSCVNLPCLTTDRNEKCLSRRRLWIRTFIAYASGELTRA